jgi:prevent-host-death family protein
MTRSASVAEARNSLTRLIQAAEQGQTVHITRRGKPVAVLVSEEEYTRLKAGTPQKDFWQTLQEWREQADFDWPELTPEEVDSWRDRSPGREFSWDD